MHIQSNNASLYEKYDFSARIAYNWRDKFLAQANRGAGEPLFTEEYEQIDISASQAITEAFSVSFAGINITGEDIRQSGRNESQFIFGEEGNARYEIGARYNF